MQPHGPFPLSSKGCGVHDFQKEFQILIHLTAEQFSVLSQSILNELWHREDVIISASCSHMDFSLFF